MNCPNCGHSKGESIICSNCGHSSDYGNSYNERPRMILFRPWHLIVLVAVLGYIVLFSVLGTTLEYYFTSDPEYTYLEKGFEYSGKPKTLDDYVSQIDLMFQIEGNRHPENSFTLQIGSALNFILLILFPFGVYLLYFLPSLIGSYKTSGWTIFFLNVLFGWTFFIWFLCLALAFKNSIGGILESFSDGSKKSRAY